MFCRLLTRHWLLVPCLIRASRDERLGHISPAVPTATFFIVAILGRCATSSETLFLCQSRIGLTRDCVPLLRSIAIHKLNTHMPCAIFGSFALLESTGSLSRLSRLKQLTFESNHWYARIPFCIKTMEY